MQHTRTLQGAGPAGFDTAGRANEHDFASAFIDTMHAEGRGGRDHAMSAGRHIRLTSSPPERHRRRRSAPPVLRLLALLLVALGLFAAAPAAAQTTIWSTTLEVDVSGKYGRFGTFAGCDDAHDGQADCIATLFDNDFRFDGTTYRVTALYHARNSGSVSISFDKDLPSGILDDGVLVLGEEETELAFGDAEQTGKQAKWLDASFDWSDYQRIPVSLKVPTEGAPSGLVVTEGATQLDLQWTAPSGTVTAYHVHYTSSGSRLLDGDSGPSGGTPSRAWADAGYSGGTTPSHSITGLTTGTVYRLRVRAVTASGAGPWAFATGTPVTPPPVGSQIPVWSATLTVDMDTRFVTLEWGCDDKSPVLDDCSTALTDNDFVFNGTTYIVKSLYLLGNRISGGFTVWQVVLDFDKPTPTTTLTLHLDTAQLLTSNAQRMYSTREVGGRITADARDRNARWRWYRHERDGDSYYKKRGVSWTDGQQVSVKLTWAAKPRDLTVTPGNARLDLSWRAPAGPAVTGYDVHYTSAPEAAVADGTAAFGSDASLAWVAATRAGTTASQTIPSLDNDTAYRVRVGARTGSGTGEWAFGSGTPAASCATCATAGETGVIPAQQSPYASLIAQMREWRDDPLSVHLKAHTDRWDRALLAFGETVSDGALTPMTAAEAQTYADRGWNRWVEVTRALGEIEASARNAVPPPQPTQVPQPLYDSLIADVNTWRNDPLSVHLKPHTDRWDRVLLTLGEPVSDTSFSTMSATEAQTYADRGWSRWVGVVAALKVVKTGTSGADTLTGTSSGELLVGLAGDDDLSGLGGDDELRGGGGDDDLTGGAGSDRFVFFSAQTGAKAITDFSSGDVVVLKGDGWSSVADIIAGVQAVGSSGYRYTLASGLTVETTNNRTLRTEDFVTD